MRACDGFVNIRLLHVRFDHQAAALCISRCAVLHEQLERAQKHLNFVYIESEIVATNSITSAMQKHQVP